MARAGLDWPIEVASRSASISSRTLLRFENEQRDIKPELIARLRQTYEAAGVRFLDAEADAGGVVPPSPKMQPPP